MVPFSANLLITFPFICGMKNCRNRIPVFVNYYYLRGFTGRTHEAPGLNNSLLFLSPSGIEANSKARKKTNGAVL